MSAISVLHICETARGGVGTCIGLFAEFDPSEIVSKVVAPKQHASHIGDRLDVVTFDRPDRGLRATMNMVRTAQRVAREFDPDVILCHSAFSLAAVAWFKLNFSGRPIIFCPHGMSICRYDEGSSKYNLVRAIEGRALGLADVTVQVSEYERKLAETLGYRGRHIAIENAVRDVTSQKARDAFADQDKTHLLFVGRLDRQKGFDILADAMRLADRPDLVLHVVGESVNKDSDFGELPDNIIMHGWVEAHELDGWYKSADALIVPSRWEAFGLVVAEAFRNGTPALVSDRCALPDNVTEGETGHIFPLEAKAVAETLRTLDREALRRMEPACRATYEQRFTIARYRAEFMSLFNELVRPNVVLEKEHV